jgi:hypothetical protein
LREGKRDKERVIFSVAMNSKFIIYNFKVYNDLKILIFHFLGNWNLKFVKRALLVGAKGAQ